MVKIHRDYNNRVASETMEDYALRFKPHHFRKWSEWRVANTAVGAASLLVIGLLDCRLCVMTSKKTAKYILSVDVKREN